MATRSPRKEQESTAREPNRIRQLRDEHELRPAFVAATVGVDQTTLQRWERGKTEPSTEHMRRLAALFDVGVPYLMGWADRRRAA